MQAFADPAIKAIVSTIGGEDSIRLLPYLDLNVLRDNPKIFLGYSDSTVTHFACHKASIGSFYGPSIMAGFGENGGLFPYMVESVKKTLFSIKPIGRLQPNTQGWTDERLDWGIPENQAIKRKLQPCTSWNFLQGKGIHSGQLIGGCYRGTGLAARNLRVAGSSRMGRDCALFGNFRGRAFAAGCGAPAALAGGAG